MPEGGYIKVWRKMLGSEVMQDDWLCRLWMWCLLRARWNSERTGLSRGQFITTGDQASDELRVTRSKWYRGIERLLALKCITVEANNKRTTITVCNYETYQDSNEEESPSANNQRTTYHCNKELEEERKGERSESTTPEFDPLSIELPAEMKTPAFSAAWSEWINYRRERRLSLRQTTVAKQLKFLASFGELGAIESIEASIRNAWNGIFPPKVAKAGRHETAEELQAKYGSQKEMR